MGQDLIHVYVRSGSGDLVEYLSDYADGERVERLRPECRRGCRERGPPAHPVPSTFPAQDKIHVYVQSASGDMDEYISDHAFGRVWNAYDLSAYAVAGA